MIKTDIDLLKLIKRVGGPFYGAGKPPYGYYLPKFYKYLNNTYSGVSAAALNSYLSNHNIDNKQDLKEIVWAIILPYLDNEKTQQKWADIAYPLGSTYDSLSLSNLDDIQALDGSRLPRAFYDDNRWEFIENIAATLWVFLSYNKTLEKAN